MSKFLILSIFVVFVPHVLSWDLSRLQRSAADTGGNQNVSSSMSPPTDNTSTPNTTTAIANQDPVTVNANFTSTGNQKTSQEPMRILATINTSKSEEGKVPLISLMPPQFPGGPFGLVALVPPQRPVEINADVPPDTSVSVQTEVSPDVPLVAIVLGHGKARFYSPWKKASSTGLNMFNVNVQ